ncbi:MAG: GTP-binding protein [Promethearchaeota archaeon]
MLEEKLKTVLISYINEVEGILAVSICDRDGLIITSEGRSDIGDDIIGGLSAILDSYIDRIKAEFETQSNFCNITNMGDKKFIYCSMGPNSILTTISEPDTSDVTLRVLSEYVAEKIELILNKEEVSLEIPDIVKSLSKTREGKFPPGKFSIKLILTGDFKVGKTSLIKRFVEDTFHENYISTIGVQISKKSINLGSNTEMNFIIWDIGGQKTMVAPNFYRGANAAFIVVDRTREETLTNVKRWQEEITRKVSQKIPVVIVGNKSDLIDKIVLTKDDIKTLADQHNFHYILTSAKTGENVNGAFFHIAFKMIELF